MKFKADFEKLFEECENRIHAIITFLALLEMVNLQQLKITKGENLNQFWVEEKPEEEPEPEQELTAMEIALRQALEKSESNEASHSKQKPRKKKDTESDQDEILARTLEKKFGKDA